jgi:hypothetical protein
MILIAILIYRTLGRLSLLIGKLALSTSFNEGFAVFSTVENHFWDHQTGVGCIPENHWTLHDLGGIIRYIQLHHAVLVVDSPPQS